MRLQYPELLATSRQFILWTFYLHKEPYRRDSAAFDMPLTQYSVERPLDAY